jgi:nitroreductase
MMDLKEIEMNYESLLELVKNRRSIKKFKVDPIPDEYIDKIIEVARWAPSGANSQPWEFIVVKKQETREKLLKIFEESDGIFYRMEMARDPQMRFPVYRKPPKTPCHFAAAPVYIIVCGDPRTKEAYPLSANVHRRDSIFNSSLANAFLYMNLAVTSLGLASQWMTSASHPFEQSLIKQVLGIPLELEIYDMMVLGFPDSNPRPRLVRAREEIVHFEQYDRTKFRTVQQVKDFIQSIYH